MLLGLAGGPSAFQRLLNNIFVTQLDEFVVVYVDAVPSYSKTEEDRPPFEGGTGTTSRILFMRRD